MIRNALASTETDDRAEVAASVRAEAVAAVRLQLADARTEDLLPDEEAALVERFASAAVLARPVPAAARAGLIRQVVEDVSRALRGRAGPLDAALRDADVFDIMVNAPDALFVRRAGSGIVRLGESFPGNDEVDAFVARFAARGRRQFSEADPLLNVQLPSGTRLNAVRYPVARDGTALSLRLHSRFPPWAELLQLGVCPDGQRDWSGRRVRVRPGYPGPEADADAFLRWMVRAGARFVVLGGTGAGKTTQLNALGGLIPPEDRIVVIEDTRELRLPQPNVVHLETREFVPEGAKVLTQFDLVQNALRMFPTRLWLGEVRRGDVLLAWLRAARSGHPGSAFTFHAPSAGEFLEAAALELQMAMPGLAAEIAARMLAGAIHLVIRYGVHPEYDVRLVQEIAALSVGTDRLPVVTTLYHLVEERPGFPALVPTGAVPPWLSPEGYLPV